MTDNNLFYLEEQKKEVIKSGKTIFYFISAQLLLKLPPKVQITKFV
jgi:hypothetical protein